MPEDYHSYSSFIHENAYRQNSVVSNVSYQVDTDHYHIGYDQSAGDCFSRVLYLTGHHVYTIPERAESLERRYVSTVHTVPESLERIYIIKVFIQKVKKSM